ncbi:MAG: SIMPL domain-containing protein [Planctomycetota bacterium]|jgi:uncharacterized protein YggE
MSPRLSAIEGVSIQNTQYAHSDRIKYQNESREKAVLAAQEKANKLAVTLGAKVGTPLKVEEVSAPQIYRSNWGSNANFASNSIASYSEGDSSSELALGQITISTRVRVIFKLHN